VVAQKTEMEALETAKKAAEERATQAESLAAVAQKSASDAEMAQKSLSEELASKERCLAETAENYVVSPLAQDVDSSAGSDEGGAIAGIGADGGACDAAQSCGGCGGVAGAFPRGGVGVGAEYSRHEGAAGGRCGNWRENGR